MSKQTFTPGPWVARSDPDAALRDDWMIGTPDGKPDEVAVCSKRDAKLIASAPDGYALAEAIIRLASSPLQSDYVPPEIQTMARAILTKVGETS